MLIIVGVIWLLGQTSTIVVPVIVAAVLGAVAGPAVGWLQRHRIPRIGGAILVLLGLVAIGALIVFLVFGGISAQADDISAKLNQGLEKLRVWFADLGVEDTQQAKQNVQKSAPEIKDTLLGGISTGINGLSSLVFFLGFAALSTLFVLKDGPVMQRFIDRHMGVPQPVAHVVTTNVAKSLRSYFLGVSIIAGFNAVVIGIAAVVIGVPLAGTIAVVTFVGAFVPFVGAWVAGALRGADRARHRGHGRRDRHGGRLAAGQQRAAADDPAAGHGRDARAQPARRPRGHDRRRRAVRDGRADARRAADLGGRAHQQRAARPQRDAPPLEAVPAPSG